MPCGGIIVMQGPGELAQALNAGKGGCWWCSKGGCRHFMQEWDTFVHARCVLLAIERHDEELAIVFNHGHTVELDFSLERD